MRITYNANDYDKIVLDGKNCVDDIISQMIGIFYYLESVKSSITSYIQGLWTGYLDYLLLQSQ